MKNTIRELQNQRSELNGLVLYSIVLGISVNILSGILSELLNIKPWINLIIWGVISLGIIISSQVLKYKGLNTKVELQGLLITDETSKNKLIEVPNYHISMDMKEYYESACSENNAYRKIWENSGLDKAKDGKTHKEQLSMISESSKLLVELIEYCLLERLSTFIEDYFNKRGVSQKCICCLGKDIPDVLLQNRFLKLFSEEPKNRAAFCGVPGKFTYTVECVENNTDDENTIVYMMGDNGALYQRFSLIIPKGSKVYRESENTVVVDTKIFTLKHRVVFEGFSTYVERDFYTHYLHTPNDDGFHNWQFDIEVEVIYKFIALFKPWDWKYYNWLDEYLRNLSSYCDIETFYEDIGWKEAKTVLRILKTPKMSKDESTQYADANDSSYDKAGSQKHMPDTQQ